MSFPGAPPELSLGAAVATVHRDPRWWAKCLLYGGLALTGLGVPLAAGFVLESYDNSRKGFPTPLPPWTDPTTRWLAGLFALLIDFTFYVLPLLVAGLLLFCASLGLLLSGSGGQAVISAIVGLYGVFALAMFASSVSPAGRLRFADDGRPEQALSADTLRWALGPAVRGSLLRARLASLPPYLPALLLGGALFALSRFAFPGQALAVAALLWLILSAVVYAHLVAAQLYVAAEREARRRTLGM